MQHQLQMSCKAPDASACPLQAPSLAVLLPQDAAGELGLLSKSVAAPSGRGITRAQLLRCVADFYAAELSHEALVAAMQVRYTNIQLHSCREDAIGCTSLLLRCIAVFLIRKLSHEALVTAMQASEVLRNCDLRLHLWERAVRFSYTWSVCQLYSND